MAGRNQVTLTIAGDASGLEKAARDSQRAMQGVQESSTHAGEGLRELGAQARGTREILRGLGDASVLVGGEEGQMATQAIFAAGAIKDLARGSGELVKSLGLVRIATGGVITAIAVIGAGISAHIDHTNIFNEVNRTAADTSYYLADGLNFVGQKVPGLGGALGWLKGKTDDWSKAAHGGTVEAYNFADAIKAAEAAMKASGLGQGITDDPDGMAFSATMLDGTNAQSAQFMANLQADADSAAAAARKRSGGGAARAVSSAASDAKRAAEQAAKDLADAKRTVARAVADLVDAFRPQLTVDQADGFNRVGNAGGASSGGLIGHLKKQAADTLRLRQDLEKLAKMGLNKGLLSELVAGGLNSLPAAEDLLHGGKAEIGQANYYAGRINVRSNMIATEETARNLTKKDRQTLHVNVTGGDADLVKLVRKWVRNNGGNVQSVLGS